VAKLAAEYRTNFGTKCTCCVKTPYTFACTIRDSTEASCRWRASKEWIGN